MNMAMSLSRFGLIAVALVAPPRSSLAQAQQQQPPPREDNIWGGKAHQPSEAEVLQREKDAGIARSAGNQQDVEQNLSEPHKRVASGRGTGGRSINPTPRHRRQLRARFDRMFCRRTGFVSLDRLLARLHANKAELLAVLNRPEIPLHTNGSERDIRCHVTKRKVSGGTRSDVGRDCRDAFLGLAKTCAKLGIAFWDYLGSRLGVSGQPTVLPLPDLIHCRGQLA
jgi:hypothetical protein